LTFIGDTSGSNGGAVYLHTQTQSQLPNNFFYLTDSVFVNNSALSGGAIYMASNNSQNPISFSVTTGMFSQNSASAGNGGAIYNYVVGGGNVISSYTIIGNNVFSNNSASAGNGGAIANSVSNVNNGVNTFIESAQFANNSAINGGAISNEAEGGNTNNSFNIFGTFTGNQASSCGGAIYSSIGKNGNSPYGGTNVYIISATFNSNSASDSGGAIYNYINKGQSSGAMYLSSNWNGNSAVSNGGAIYNYSDLDLYILSSSVFQNNSASLGGAIYNAKGNIYLTSVADGDITFLGNRASQGSDVFAAAGSVLYINGSFGQIYFGGGMAGNGTIVKSNGGMIYLANTSDNSKFNGQFNQTGGETQCEGIMFGGINDIYGGILKVCSTESYITYNVNLYDGATLNHWTRNLMLTNVFPGVQNGVGLTFKGNSSIANFWSGIPGTGDNFVPASYSLSKIDNGDKNTIIFNNSIVKLKGTDYSGNTIYSFADSVLDLASSSTTVSTYTFNNLGVTNASLRFKVVNSASGNLTSDTLYVTSPTASGAEIQIDKIYLMDDPSYSPIIGATVTVLTYQNDGALTFQNQTIEQYTANTNFAYIITTTPNRFGIYFSSFTISTEITLDMVNINSMSASGARSFQIPNKTTYSNRTTLHQMASGTFSVFGHDRYASVLSGKSTSGTSGSLFKIWGDTTAVFDLTDLTVQDAYASNTDYGDESGNGAVLRMVNGSTVSIIGVTIQNSSAVYSGGAVFQDSGVLTLSNIYFIGNSAGTNGGAVSHKNGDISISIAKFDSNTAVSSGGAIYNSSGSISIGANVLGTVLFSSNSAGTAGGAIYNDVNGQIELASGLSSDILFVNNSAGGQVNDIYNDGTIIIDGQAGNVNITGGISGNNNAANIIKSSYGDLTLGINSDNSKYVGSFTQTDGNINVYGKFFGGISTITGGILNWYATDHAAKSSSSVLNINNAVLQISGDGSFLSLNNNLDSISSNTVVINR
jgi:predicted outer membrane repeat protein